jgi:hypothetical protein
MPPRNRNATQALVILAVWSCMNDIKLELGEFWV